MSQPTSQTQHDPPAPSRVPSSGELAFRRALPWLGATALVLAIAGAGGLGAAYLVASLSAVPSPDAAFLPTPTPRPIPSPRPSATPGGAPSAAPTATPVPTPTPGPTVEPTPEGTPIVYIVQRGDTINRIATRHGVTPESIISLNELSNPNRITPGQRLLIPAAPASPVP